MYILAISRHGDILYIILRGGLPVKEFDVNSGFMYVMAGIVVCFVLAQSIFFLVKSWRRAKTLGMQRSILRGTVISSALFSIAPAIAILLGVVTLSKFLGLPLPWIRENIIGALTYELPAALAGASATGADTTRPITDPRAFSTITWVMSLGIIPGLILVPLFAKKIQGGVMKLGMKDKKWGELFMSALFIGMIAAFLGMVFKDINTGLAGWVPVFVMLVSAVVMGIIGILIKKCKITWLEEYALPFSMLCSMAAAIPITNWVR